MARVAYIWGVVLAGSCGAMWGPTDGCVQSRLRSGSAACAVLVPGGRGEDPGTRAHPRARRCHMWQHLAPERSRAVLSTGRSSRCACSCACSGACAAARVCYERVHELEEDVGFGRGVPLWPRACARGHALSLVSLQCTPPWFRCLHSPAVAAAV